MGKYLELLMKENDYSLFKIAHHCGFPETTAQEYLWRINRFHPDGIMLYVIMLKGDYEGTTWSFLFKEFEIHANFPENLKQTHQLDEDEYVFQMSALFGDEYIKDFKNHKRRERAEKKNKKAQNTKFL